MSGITPGYERSDVGKLLDADPRLGIQDRFGNMGRAAGLYLRCEGTSALVTVTVTRWGTQARRRFHIGLQRSCWLAVGGWEHVTVTVDQIGAGATSGKASAVWTETAPPQLATLVLVELFVAAGAVSVPEGAIAVLPSVGDGAATQTVSLALPLVVATPLVTGVKTDVVGNLLNIGVVPQHLAWFLEGF